MMYFLKISSAYVQPWDFKIVSRCSDVILFHTEVWTKDKSIWLVSLLLYNNPMIFNLFKA